MRKIAAVILLELALTGTGAQAADEFRIGGSDNVQSVLTSLKGSASPSGCAPARS